MNGLGNRSAIAGNGRLIGCFLAIWFCDLRVVRTLIQCPDGTESEDGDVQAMGMAAVVRVHLRR